MYRLGGRQVEGGPVSEQHGPATASQGPTGLEEGLQRADPIADVRQALATVRHIVGKNDIRTRRCSCVI